MPSSRAWELDDWLPCLEIELHTARTRSRNCGPVFLSGRRKCKNNRCLYRGDDGIGRRRNGIFVMSKPHTALIVALAIVAALLATASISTPAAAPFTSIM